MSSILGSWSVRDFRSSCQMSGIEQESFVQDVNERETGYLGINEFLNIKESEIFLKM